MLGYDGYKSIELNFSDFSIGGDEARHAVIRVTQKTISEPT